MQSPDRSRFIELLGQLGAEDDATVLAAARELHRTVQDADSIGIVCCKPMASPMQNRKSNRMSPRLPSRKCRRKRLLGQISPMT